MSDPTYKMEEINANPEWELAFFLSELDNDFAPIGWGRYIQTARYLLKRYEITLRGETTDE